ncbi:hypothetical protein F7725_016401 [Dissostichus mawsoni]|uniref:Fucolectin tachylectin-4 pentraxin-1 domain-containing protein n=1 Tax=Dissostichus mawsoni TaxID=36200 RepID=A0A7J5Z5S8_DISMA|nr:hypothetical protein F7725_016401 [Dissostichus mawsoni]
MTSAVFFALLAFLGLTYGNAGTFDIAKGGKVTQSSIAFNGNPERAVDGNLASVYNQNSCTHTKKQRNPWWRLDLQKTYRINTVTITNRKDCCSDRINGAEIRVGNSLNARGNPNPICAVISSIEAGTSKTFECNGMDGQYVTIVIRGREEYLTLCEVEVTGQPSGTFDIAKGGKVTQSSIAFNGNPERAVDGNLASVYNQNSCTHTKKQRNPWWRLDLQKTYRINTVTITNRKDCCSDRINGAEIRVGNSLNARGNPNPILDLQKTYRINTVTITNRKDCCSDRINGTFDIAKGGKVTQSSIAFNGNPERAVDGNLASVYNQNSCTHTKKQRNPWWRLDLQNTYRINTVTITNRKDCCSDRINGAEIRVGNSLNARGNPNPICAVISSIEAGTSKTFECNGMDGQYVTIVIRGREEYLTLCENSCTHTKKQRNPWWRLDLQKTYRINTVTITNRKDCCSDRINGAEIRVGNSLNARGNPNPICAVISSIEAGTSKTFECNGMDGQYVTIVIRGREEYLTLCEVLDIAKGGKVTQSSIAFNGNPERANSCTHTKKQRNPWWRLDLQKTYRINTVTITNRKDCCSDRINGAEIRVGNSLNARATLIPCKYSCSIYFTTQWNQFLEITVWEICKDFLLCAVISSIEAGTSKTFECNGMDGQYVTIVIPGREEYLTLCEVEVTGSLDIAKGGKVTQSSIAFNGNPERAVDGNLASVYNQNSCTHTKNNETHGGDWTFKRHIGSTLSPSPTGKIVAPIGSMYIFYNTVDQFLENISLGDLCKDFLLCAVISSIEAGTSKTFECNGMEGQYVTIVIPGREEYLTLCEVEVTGQPSGSLDIAKGGKVTQSSIAFNGNPERAVDGNLASVYNQNSCTHTKKQRNPWWRLDLQKTYRINTVTITNRKDCCSDRINGAEIRVGNSLNAKGNPNPICAVISSIEAGTSKTFECNGMEGQYVTIVIPGREEYLTLCEVEVTGQPSGSLDIAKGGKVTQSSIAFNGNPERAVDGNLASVYNQNSCTHTKKQRNPWWRLDLQKTYRINTVTITNRKDCCSDRINGAEIRVGNSLNAKGNPNPILDIAKGGKVTQSSIAFNGNPERAVDGNLASVYNQNSCTHTKKQRNPWWRLDLQKTYRINTVTITNRKDCCSDRINGAEIRVGNSLNAKGNPNPICAVISSIEAGTSKTFECNGMEGQYVIIVIPGREEYLTLCEVEVTGQPSGTFDIAKGGKVTQSSIAFNGNPERAVDGNLASVYNQNSCTHTKKQRNPWWRLDLQKTYRINTVTITNRKDCCSDRINGAEIRVGNSLNAKGNPNTICAVISSIEAGTSKTFECNGMEGQYVTIVIPGREEYLTLCEVEVTGTEAK